MIEKISRLKEYSNQLKDRDYDLLPLERILDNLRDLDDLLNEIKVSYSSEEGLERFASEYRNRPNIESKLNNFKLIEDFFENKLSDYQKIKRYLENRRLKIPEEDKYKKLRELKERLVSSLKNDNIVFGKEFFANFQEQFLEFQEKYIEVYRKEHKRQLADDRFRKYEKIKQSKSYKILKSLSKLRIISVKDDLIKVDRLLAKAQQKECNKFSLEELKERPVCECGFQLGEKIELPSRKKIEESIKSGIKQYLHSVKENENKQKIEEYLANMEAVGEKRFARPIRNLLKLSSDDENLISDLDDIINSIPHKYDVINFGEFFRVYKVLLNIIGKKLKENPENSDIPFQILAYLILVNPEI